MRAPSCSLSTLDKAMKWTLGQCVLIFMPRNACIHSWFKCLMLRNKAHTVPCCDASFSLTLCNQGGGVERQSPVFGVQQAAHTCWGSPGKSMRRDTPLISICTTRVFHARLVVLIHWASAAIGLAYPIQKTISCAIVASGPEKKRTKVSG